MNVSLKKSDLTPSNSFIFFACLCILSLLTSPFLLSISMWGFCAVALWETYAKTSPNLVFWPRLRSAFSHTFRMLWQKRAYLAFTLLFFVVFGSGFWSDDLGFWLERTRVRIPFFVLPWAFANAPKISQKQSDFVLKTLVWMMFVLCLGVGINYLMHQEAILTMIQQGQAIPVPRNHIRFSLTLAFSCFLAWHFSRNTSGKWQWVYGFVALFFFAFAHFLAVRSGLLALYLVCVFMLMRLIFFKKKWLLGLGLLLALPALLFFAQKHIPSLAQKVDYMQWEFKEYREGRGVDYSDAGRWSSIAVGWDLWKNHPLLGVGVGDLDKKSKEKTAELYPRLAEVYKLPHNQYVYILASSGLLGMLLSFYAFFGFLRKKTYRNSLFCLVFLLIAHSSFLTEYTIETAIGVAFYLFFTLFLMLQEE